MIIAIGLFPGFTSLDAIGPYEVFSALPGAEVVLCAAEPTLDDGNNMLHLRVDATFDEVARPDVLLIPGGPGTRRLAAVDHPIVDWVRNAHPHTRWTTSVCTGALVLGAAGLLDGLPATTHWHFYDLLAGYGAHPTEQRVVRNDAERIATAAGVSAGIDLALTLAAELAGPEVAQGIQLAIEYDPQPPFDAGAPSKAPRAVRDAIAARFDQFDRLAAQ
ncbi:DJ-1/PfpI family protein [Nocardia arthritidis]|uniref:DJ-1/PfpI family protein n=1 Tax=Nocardia arthritidis TaxID=228602 RepID=UPI00142D5D19|nr:DJ-1/PfpI family protein [Nocardia arthritidis]